MSSATVQTAASNVCPKLKATQNRSAFLAGASHERGSLGDRHHAYAEAQNPERTHEHVGGLHVANRFKAQEGRDGVALERGTAIATAVFHEEARAEVAMGSQP